MSDEPRNNGEGTPKRQMPEGRRFQPGNPGRPKGSRNKLGEDFIHALHESFQANGPETIEAVRVERPHEYLKVIASLLPKELKVTTESDLTDDQLDQRIRQLAAAISLELNGSEAGIGSASDGAETPVRPDALN